MQIIVRQFIVVYVNKLYTAKLVRATPEMKTFSYVIQSHLMFQLEPNFSFCLIVEKHHTIHNEKRGNSRFYRMLYFLKRNSRCLVDPCVFPVCSAAYKVVQYSEYQNFSNVSLVHFNFFRINLSDCCREEFGMSNFSNILCRASP